MIRAFLAVELPQELRTTLGTLQQNLKRPLDRILNRGVKVSWVRPASLHLTLRFLGDMPEESIQLLRGAIEQVVSAHQALSIPLERVGVFPRLQQPRVLWVGPSESWEESDEAKRLTALHRAIEDCCQAADFAPESRPFSAHLTLARIKEGVRQVGQALTQCGVMDQAVMIGELPAEAIALVRSELRPTGSIYTKLWEVQIS